jgi:hypothetical protein
MNFYTDSVALLWRTAMQPVGPRRTSRCLFVPLAQGAGRWHDKGMRTRMTRRLVQIAAVSIVVVGLLVWVVGGEFGARPQ